MIVILKKPLTFISYLDMNNLYGWAMTEYLNHGGCKWLKNVDVVYVMSINEKRIFKYNIFSKLTLNILINYMYYTMIIH